MEEVEEEEEEKEEEEEEEKEEEEEEEEEKDTILIHSDDSPSLGMRLSSGMGLTYLTEAWNRVLNVINHCPLHGSHK